jgi:hypothetical protein
MGSSAIRVLFVSYLLCTVLALPLRAAIVTWTSAANGFWDIPANWSSNPNLPMTSDDVSNSTALTITHRMGTDTVNSFTTTGPFLLTGGTLMINKNLQINGTSFTLNGGTLKGATVGVSGPAGALVFDSNVSNVLDGVTFKSSADLDLTNGGFVLIRNGLTLDTFSRSFLDNGGEAFFDGKQTFGPNNVGGPTINFGGTGTNRVGMTAGTTLTLSGISVSSAATSVSGALLGNVSPIANMPTGLTFDCRGGGCTNSINGPVTIAGDTVTNTFTSTLDLNTNQLTQSNTIVAKTAVQNDGKIVVNRKVDITTPAFNISSPFGGFTVNGATSIKAATGDTAVTSAGDIFVAPGVTFTIAGNLTQNTGGTLKVNGQLVAMNGQAKKTVTLNGGVLTGTQTPNNPLSGRITANVVNKQRVKPGDAPGILTIDGDYTQSSEGALAIEIDRGMSGPIACDGPGCYSQLDVTGSTTLDGTLDVTLDSGLAIGDLFAIINNLDESISVDGTFKGLGEDGTFSVDFGGFAYLFEISYDGNVISPSQVTFDGGNDVVLKVIAASPVSEPSSLVTLMSAAITLAAGGWFRQRRRRPE